MSRKSIGINGEREILNKLREFGFSGIRAAGSGTTKWPTPDILAAREGCIIAMEVKVSSGDKIYVRRREINELLSFSSDFNALPVLSVRFRRGGWRIFNIAELDEKGANFLAELRNGNTLVSFINNLSDNLSGNRVKST